MKKIKLNFIILFLLLGGMIVLQYQCTPAGDKKAEPAAMIHEEQVERGRYLVNIGGCNDCHTPKIMTPQGPIPDETLTLSGHPENGVLPEIDPTEITPGKWYLAGSDLTSWVGPWGISFPVNLTPDSATGTGAWTEELFIKILRSGKFMGVDAGRPIMPPMPWQQIGKLKDEDLKAIFAYLHSLKPIRNAVPAYVPPNEIPVAKKKS